MKKIDQTFWIVVELVERAPCVQCWGPDAVSMDSISPCGSLLHVSPISCSIFKLSYKNKGTEWQKLQNSIFKKNKKTFQILSILCILCVKSLIKTWIYKKTLLLNVILLNELFYKFRGSCILLFCLYFFGEFFIMIYLLP